MSKEERSTDTINGVHACTQTRTLPHVNTGNYQSQRKKAHCRRIRVLYILSSKRSKRIKTDIRFGLPRGISQAITAPQLDATSCRRGRLSQQKAHTRQPAEAPKSILLFPVCLSLLYYVQLSPSCTFPCQSANVKPGVNRDTDIYVCNLPTGLFTTARRRTRRDDRCSGTAQVQANDAPLSPRHRKVQSAFWTANVGLNKQRALVQNVGERRRMRQSPVLPTAPSFAAFGV